MHHDDPHGLHIGGTERPAADGATAPVENPATGEVFAEVAVGTAADVDDAVATAREAFLDWRATPPEERGRIVAGVADEIRAAHEELAALETRDQGKPLAQARSDFEGAARYFEYYGGAADKLDGRSIPMGPDQVDFTVREPYGVSAQITPWNFPGNLFARGVAPALVAGNTVVVKPAPQTPLSTLRLAELVESAGVPPGVVNVVPGPGDPTGAALTGHPDVDTITFTGSVATGRQIMETAAEHVTPVTLELGGKNPAIVFPDADLETAVDWIDTGIYTNAGQVCSAADRALVHTDVHDEFVDRFTDVAQNYHLGAGDADPDMGPLVSEAHFETVTDYIALAEAEGATIAAGGDALDRDGYFVEPTVITDVDPEMRIAQEEIFGPVLCVIPFSDREEAVEIANDIELGLTGGVFSENVTDALQTAREIEAGSIYVNQWFGGSAAVPFGGYKKSGIGRELGMQGLESYFQSKNVCVNLDDD